MTYRKIWEEAHGPIPKDKDGRSYEIHHIDGEHSNNSLENLVAVSIEEHFDIHYKQGDIFACKLIASRYGLQKADLSELTKEQWAKRSAAERKEIGNKISNTLKQKGINPYSKNTHSPEAIAKRKKAVQNTWKDSPKRWYHHPELNRVLRLTDDETVPEGFVKGRGKRTWKAQ